MRLWVGAAAAAVCLMAAETDAERWWKHVSFLASDELEGRATGSPGYAKAADYLVKQFQAAGLKPCGTKGYLQAIPLTERKLVEQKSSLSIVRGGKDIPLELGKDAYLSTRTDLAENVNAPAVFVGYGLSIPEKGFDDLKGLNLKGKIAVYISGSPAHIPGPLRAHFSSAEERNKALLAAGAIGSLAIMNPKTSDVPWARAVLSRLIPAMAESGAPKQAKLQFGAAFSPEKAPLLFEGTNHQTQELMDLATAGKPLPHFDLPFSIKAHAVVERRTLTADNVCAMLPGSEAKAREAIVLSAHLDHLGRGGAINGDDLYNGAMDNASGAATLLETAHVLAHAKNKPKRDVIFLAVAGEEKGLLGSRYYARHPTMPRIVANINFDMYLPIHPLKYVMALGLDESTLKAPLEEVCKTMGLKVQPDLEPARNRFIRSDQYSFIQQGVPALALKFGYEPKSAEEKIQHEWVSKRYHAPSDDLSQPVDKNAAAQFNQLIARLAVAVADLPSAPQWNETSFFKRFSKKPGS